MKVRFLKTYTLLFLIIININCKQSYNPPALNSNKNYLVVDGFINAGSDSTIITLTRTRNLNSTGSPTTEDGAQLTVEGDKGYSSQLASFGNGRYGASNLNLDNMQNYRLRIITNNGSTYVSDFVPVKLSPPIDSISWQRGDSGVSIAASTHDPSNNTRYYRWDYIETWQYNSAYPSYYHYNPIDSTESATGIPVPYNCWRTDNSSNILIASSAKLTSDIIYNNRLLIIPPGTEKISVKYSILVRQYALTSDAFNYWETLLSSTEQTGTLFDQQPSQITGNIHCITNPNEPVIGYIGAGSIATARIFIRRSQVDPWEYEEPCGLKAHSADSLTYFINEDMLVVSQVLGGPNGVSGYVFSSNFCVDCTLKGGTDVMPSFWQ